MYYTGVDLPRRTSYLTAVDQRGKVVARAHQWGHSGREGIHVIISNPIKTKAIAAQSRIPREMLRYKEHKNRIHNPPSQTLPGQPPAALPNDHPKGGTLRGHGAHRTDR